MLNSLQVSLLCPADLFDYCCTGDVVKMFK